MPSQGFAKGWDYEQIADWKYAVVRRSLLGSTTMADKQGEVLCALLCCLCTAWGCWSLTLHSSAEPVVGPQWWVSKVRSPVHTSVACTSPLLRSCWSVYIMALPCSIISARVLLVFQLAAHEGSHLCAATEYPPLSTTTQTFCLPGFCSTYWVVHCLAEPFMRCAWLGLGLAWNP